VSTPPPPLFSPPSAGPSGVLTPGEAPPKKTPVRLVLIGIVVIVLVAAGVFVATRSDDDGGGGVGGKAKSARTALQGIVDDADFNTDGEADLDRCPLGRLKALDELVSAEVDLGDLPDGDGNYQVNDATDVDPQLVICSQTAATFESESGPFAIAYEALLDPPKNLEAYLNDVADAAGESFTGGDPEPVEGGTIHRGCQDNAFAPVCSAVWANADGGLAIAVLVVGGGADDVDASNALQQVLTTVLDNLASS
jgi:hypothetical protein